MKSLIITIFDYSLKIKLYFLVIEIYNKHLYDFGTNQKYFLNSSAIFGFSNLIKKI